MKWITRAHVHVDRVACPWLIKRFIDSLAEFIFVTPNLVNEITREQEAIPFDVKDVELGHHDGHCTFVAIIQKYNLKDPALLAMADVIDAADSGRLDTSPYATGLEAIAQGFSLIYPDDFENLESQFLVYDALYAFFKLKLAAAKP